MPDSSRAVHRPRAALGWARVAARFAWPAAFVATAAMTLAFLREHPPGAASTVHVEHAGPTLVKSLHEVSRLETTTLHLEKIVEIKDQQKRLFGLVESADTLLFVASGEVVVGVDLAKVTDGDARFDAATRTAYVTLSEPEVLTTRFDEMHSYVHARSTDVLAQRNEALESYARREATTAFERAGRERAITDRAKRDAERELRALAKSWGAGDLVVTWRPAVAGELGVQGGPPGAARP